MAELASGAHDRDLLIQCRTDLLYRSDLCWLRLASNEPSPPSFRFLAPPDAVVVSLELMMVDV